MASLFSSWVRLSPARQFIADLMYLSRQVPTVVAERRMSLGEVRAARDSTLLRPSWVAIFLKAFGLVAAQRPALRRLYLPWPWAHLHQHDENVACFSIERIEDEDPIVVFGRMDRPEAHSLADLTQYLRRCQEQPLMNFATYRRARRLARLPGLLRKAFLNAALSVSGKMRVKGIGTFGITSTASHGAGMTQILTPATSTLHYGLFELDGSLPMRLTFDHRVYDGAFAARTLVEMEKALTGPILQELKESCPGQTSRAA